MSPSSAETGIAVTSARPSRSAIARYAPTIVLNALLREADLIELVDRHRDVLNAEHPGQRRVATGLRQQRAVDHTGGVDQDHGGIGGAGAGDHVAGVLLVAGRVGDDELPPAGGEVAVRHVDRDALLALGLQAVGQQSEVKLRPARRAALAGPRQRRQLIGQDALGVVEQPADQRALAVVDATGGDEAQDAPVFDSLVAWLVAHSDADHRPPLEISLSLAPLHRGLGGLIVHPGRAALGDLLDRRLADDRFDALSASLATGQVQLMSPTVRKRTERRSIDLTVARRRDRRHRHQQAAPAHHLALVREVEARQRQTLALDVLPDVKLGPVGDREDPQMLAGVNARVEQIPQLRALVLGVPLAEAVAEREDRAPWRGPSPRRGGRRRSARRSRARRSLPAASPTAPRSASPARRAA